MLGLTGMVGARGAKGGLEGTGEAGMGCETREEYNSCYVLIKYC